MTTESDFVLGDKIYFSSTYLAGTTGLDTFDKAGNFTRLHIGNIGLIEIADKADLHHMFYVVITSANSTQIRDIKMFAARINEIIVRFNGNKVSA
jgi:hypothetical protein